MCGLTLVYLHRINLYLDLFFRFPLEYRHGVLYSDAFVGQRARQWWRESRLVPVRLTGMLHFTVVWNRLVNISSSPHFSCVFIAVSIKGDERRRAAAAPRLGGARVTELGRSREPSSAQPAKFSRPPKASEIPDSRGRNSSAVDARRVGSIAGKSVGRAFGGGTGNSRGEGRGSAVGTRNATGGIRDARPARNFSASDGTIPSRSFTAEKGAVGTGRRNHSERTRGNTSGGSSTIKDRRTVAARGQETADRTDLRATARDSIRPKMPPASAIRRVTGSNDDGKSRFGSSSKGVPASCGALRPTTETRARGSDGRAGKHRSSGGTGTGAARPSSNLEGMGVLDILKGMESTWGKTKK